MSAEPVTGAGVVRSGGGAPQAYSAVAAGPQPGNLGDILERVLDKGLVIAGDIRVNLLDIELLTIKLRLIIASVDTAREIGINWWETDPWLHGDGDRKQLQQENRELRHRLAALESGEPDDLSARDLGVRGSGGDQPGPAGRPDRGR